MSHIVDSLRKQQKMIVLGAALAVITLYIIPIDQIVSALTLPPGLEIAKQRIGEIRLKIAANDNIPADAKARIDGKLSDVQDRLTAHQYRILGL